MNCFIDTGDFLHLPQYWDSYFNDLYQPLQTLILSHLEQLKGDIFWPIYDIVK
jgi:hypothetical protein